MNNGCKNESRKSRCRRCDRWVLKYVNHGDDRTKALLNLTDFVQKFTGNMFAEKTFDNIRTMLQNPDNKWVQYVNRGLDELDPQVIKMTALNLGFQAAFVGTKQIRMNRENTTATSHGRC